MDTTPHPGIHRKHLPVIVMALVLALASLPLLGPAAGAQQDSATPSASPSVAEARCASVSDLRFMVDFIEDSLASGGGLIPVAVGVIAAASEARTLAGLVGETYRPLLNGLVVSLQDLRDIIGVLEELDTAGAKLAAIGSSVEDIGMALDALSLELQSDCPAE